MKHQPFFVALHPSQSEGEALLGDRYPSFINHLRESIRQSGFEDKASTKGVMRFRFERLISALVSVYEAIETFKSDFLKSKQPVTLPVKFIFHLIKHPNEPLPSFCETGSTIWSSLNSETLYVSRSLKLKWEDLQESDKEVHCSFQLEDEGLYCAHFTKKPEFSTERLFKYRHLLSHGNQKECFYCGLRSHLPAKCPSKFLSMETQGIQNIGYLSFQQINDTVAKVFQNPDTVHKKLVAGITSSQLKSDREMVVYASLFDIFRVFQPRFLYQLTFASVNKWRDLTSSTAKKIIIDDNNLNLAIDCLRVGQYDEAEKKFLAATGHQEEKLFYAYVGLAFLALERGRMQDMGHFLDTACSNAQKEKEKIYIYLLLTRYFKLTGDLWKAQNALSSVLKFKHNLVEANYLNALIEVASGFSEKAMGELRSTLTGPKEYFMVLMLDPQLLPFHGFIDEILQAKREAFAVEAKEKIALARSDADSMGLWLENTDDSRKEEIAKAMGIIQDQYDSSNFYDTIDVIDKSYELCILCKEIREHCLDEISARKDLLNKELGRFVSYWNVYTYKRFFSKNLEQIHEVKEKFARLGNMIKSKSGEGYQQALGLIEEVETVNELLQKSLEKMKKVASVMDCLKMYSKKLLILECLFLIVLLPVGLVVFPDSSFAQNKSLQKQIFLATGLFVAPLIAFIISLLGPTLPAKPIRKKKRT